jgi:hypothetical protein
VTTPVPDGSKSPGRWERDARIGDGQVVHVRPIVPGDAAMLVMFRKTGFPVATRFEGGVVKVRFSIEPVRGYLDELVRREDARLLGTRGDAGRETGAPC